MNAARPTKYVSWLASILIGLAWAANAVAAETLPSSSAAHSHIHFCPTNFAFGQVLAGEPVSHVFTFTNSGDRDVVVERILPGCGCTKIGDWTRIVNPGGIGIVSVLLNTEGFVGAVDKTVGIVFQDPNQPRIVLQLMGTVRRAVEIRPSTAFLNLQPDSAFGTATIWITNCLDQPLLLSAPQCTNDSLTALLSTNVFGQNYALVVSNTKALPPGAFTTTITLRTSMTHLPMLNLLAVANVVPTFSVAPGRINLAPAPLTTGQVAYVSIKNNGAFPAHFSEPLVTANGVRVDLKAAEPDLGCTAILYFPPGFQLPGGRRHTLSIKTTHPQCPLIQVTIAHLSDPTPAAPLVKRTASEVLSAPLPLVFQREAIATLGLDPDQQAAIVQLREFFIEEIGGLSQDPGAPDYLARWQRAQRSTDARLTAEIGRPGVMRLDRAMAAVEPETP